MLIIKAQESHIETLSAISKAAFASDIMVGASEIDGPPGYDSAEWHFEMMNQKHLYTVIENDTIIGGAVLFDDENDDSIMYIGRIFLSPDVFGRGYGIQLMKMIEAMNPKKKQFHLATPVWNKRTNNLYKKLGYVEERRDAETVYYRKFVCDVM